MSVCRIEESSETVVACGYISMSLKLWCPKHLRAHNLSLRCFDTMLLVTVSNVRFSTDVHRVLGGRHGTSLPTELTGFLLVAVVVLAWCVGPVRRCREARAHANDPPPSKPVVKTHEPTEEDLRNALVDLFANGKVEAVRSYEIGFLFLWILCFLLRLTLYFDCC